MDFDFKNWKLPAEVVTTLYADAITTTPSTGNKLQEAGKENKQAAKKENKPEAVPSLSYLGENAKKFTIILRSPEYSWLPDDELEFLYKITGAVKMNASDLAIINIAKQPVDFNLIKNELKPEKMLLFGINSEDIHLPIDFPEFHVQQFDHIQFLKSPEVGVVMKDSSPGTPLKNQLWAGLKKMFLIK